LDYVLGGWLGMSFMQVLEHVKMHGNKSVLKKLILNEGNVLGEII